MGKRKTIHKQVDFIDFDGQSVRVDAGMRDVLILMKDLGVNTYHSCEGEKNNSAYISANGKTAWKLVKKVVVYYVTRKYCKPNRVFVKMFRHGHKSISIDEYKDRGAQGICNPWRFEIQRGNYYTIGHSIEFSYSRFYGFRIVIRWPRQETYMLRNLLFETCVIDQTKRIGVWPAR